MPSIPKKSLKNLAIFSGALAAVVGLMVVPSYIAIGKTESALKKIELQVNEQRQLAPVFGKLIQKRREMKDAKAGLPVRVALSRDAAGTVADSLTRLAAENRMQVVGLKSDLNAQVNDVKLMQVDIVLRGQLDHYRTFLAKLTALPPLEFIERLRITATPEGLEYGLRIWIALK